MALPNSNITTTLVGQTLGTSSRDVGTLCRHVNINKWSKWKPVRFDKVVGLVEDDLKSVRYGLTQTLLSVSTAKTYTTGWGYNRPRGGITFNEPYRLGDFRNYNHQAGSPLYFTINSNVVTKYFMNTMFITNLPSIVPVYKLNGNSSAGSQSDIPLEGFAISEMSISDIGDCLFAVTAKDNMDNLLVANSEDTINCKFGTSINNNAIILSRFNIDTGFSPSSDPDFPPGATQKLELTLYPRINFFKPASLGEVRRSPEGAPTDNTGLNGYYLPAGTPFMNTPEGGFIKMLRYSWNPLEATYAYINISNLSTGVPVGQTVWPFSDLDSGDPVANFGGVTMPIGVKIVCLATIVNQDAFSRQVYLGEFTFNNNRTSAVKMFLNSNPTIELPYLTLGAGEQAVIKIEADYTSYPSYTFPIIPSPGYGQIEAFASFKFSPSGNRSPARKSKEQRLAWR